MTPRWLPGALLSAGGTLLCGGLAVIVLGWYGAARTPYLFEQNAYLISGGLLGLGLVVVGGVLFCAAWLARMAADSRDAMNRLSRRVDDLASRGEPAGEPDLVATPKGSMRHTRECPLVRGRDDLRAVPAEEAGRLRPCGVCQPASA